MKLHTITDTGMEVNQLGDTLGDAPAWNDLHLKSHVPIWRFHGLVQRRKAGQTFWTAA